MAFRYEILPMITVGVFLATSVCFAAVFVLRRRFETKTLSESPVPSWLGFGLQGLGLSFVLFFYRPFFTPLVPGLVPELLTLLFVGLISSVSVCLALEAVRKLGCAWSVSARIVTGQMLVTNGPFRYVRHPIYTAMLGMLICAWCCFGHPASIFFAVALFWAGTRFRIQNEERLLAEVYGDHWRNYRDAVPAVFPVFGSVNRRTSARRADKTTAGSNIAQ